MKLYVPNDSIAIALGADEIAAAFAKQGARPIRNGSRGLYWLEPMIEVESKEGRFAFGPISPEDAAGADLEEWAKGNGPNALGPLEDISELKAQNRQLFARAGVIDPLDMAAYRAHEGMRGFEKARKMGAQAIIDEVKTSGLRGRGGAGFPTGIKWQTVLDAKADQKYIICNADEGDSASFADRLVMEAEPLLLIEGMAIGALAVGADYGFVYLRSEYPVTARIFEEALGVARKEGLLGDYGDGRSFDIELRMGAGSYVCGEETALLESLEGKRGVVRAKPPLPAHEGLFGKPTVINNVLSLASIPVILAKGGAGFNALGFERSRGTIPVQLAGNCARGGLFEIEFGVSIGEIVEGLGGGTSTGKPVKAVQIGGPLGAYFGPEDFDLPFEYESLAARDGLLGHAGISVFDEDADLAQLARFAMEFCAIESCGKCTPCRIGSTRGVEVIDAIINGREGEKNLHILFDLCELMKAGSLCALGGFAPFPVLSALYLAPEDFGLSRTDLENAKRSWEMKGAMELVG